MAQPVIIEDSVSIAPSSTSENVIASNNSLKALQRLPFACKIMFAATQSANGLSFQLDVGAANVVYASHARIVSTSPEVPNDIVNGNFYGQAGDLLVLRVVNTTGGALTLRYKIVATPIAEPGVIVPLPPNDIVMQQGSVLITAGLVDYQILNGLRYERAPVDSIMDLFMTMSAVGLLRQVYVDQDRVAPATTFSILNRLPMDPFDVTVQDVEVPEDKEIQIPISNPTGGNLNLFWKMVLHQQVRR